MPVVVDTAHKISVTVDQSRNSEITSFGEATLKDRYLLPGETTQDMFARVATTFADDPAHAQRMYDYISKLWFMPSTPVLSNGGAERGLPISCFLNECSDSLKGIVNLWHENVWLAANGGGIGSYWGNLRSIGEPVSGGGETSGVIPFIHVQDSLTLSISQGGLRRGSAACYLPVNHPEIEEFIEMRRPTGGDSNRKALNLHHGVVIPDAFMNAVEEDAEWDLISPRDGKIIETVNARSLWIRLLTARIETGEPYLLFIDSVNRAIPEHHKLAGLEVKMSNLCVSGDTAIDVIIDSVPFYNLRMDDIVVAQNSGHIVEVKSKNLDTGNVEYKLITAAAMTNKKAKVIKLKCDGKELILTSEHMVWTKNRGYVKAIELKSDDELDLDRC